jgi:replicative DNA helicase
MGGIEPNTIYTIAGVSGSGKSSFVNSLETDLFELNQKGEFIVLNFNFEMLASRQVGRKLSYKMRKTTSDLYSGNLEENHKGLSDDDYDVAVRHAERIKQYPIYYIDSPGAVDEIDQTIQYFQSTFSDKWLIVILDHTLLTKSKTGEKERETLYELQKVFMQAKKVAQTTIIQLSQMNREIEGNERITNHTMHYPMRRDVFGGDSVFQASDYVIVLHRPEILGLTSYGPSKLPVENMIYMHFLKVREGESKILSFVNNLKYNSIDEANPFNLQQK